MIFLALLAIIVPLTMLVLLKLPARIGMSISAIVVGIVAFAGWDMPPLAIGASIAQGIHLALTIGLILFGALSLLKTLEGVGALERIKLGLHSVSQDMRIQTVLVAFALVCLMEGISGFGTPAIIAAPLLIILGFRPLAAATLVLLGDTISNTFGAVATPLLIGLGNVPDFSPDLALVVGAQVTLFDLIIGPLIPLSLVAMLIFVFGRQTHHQKWRSFREIAPWAMFIGLVYTVCTIIIVRLIGVEFAAIISGIVTLIVIALTTKHQFLIPKTIWRHHAKADIVEQTISKHDAHIPLWKAWLPYGVVIITLLITRAIPPIKQFVTTHFNAGWHNIFGFEEISSSWAILYSPGTILLIGAIFTAFFIGRSPKPLLLANKQALATTASALTALIPTIIMVQIFSNSGINTAGLASMPVYIGNVMADIFGNLWAGAAPTLGALGAFISGSSTVSTLTMSPIQYSIAVDTGLPIVIILALQMVGAAAGNIIAIHNVVSVSTVVGLAHREGMIIRKLILPTTIYLIVAGSLGLLAVWLFS